MVIHEQVYLHFLLGLLTRDNLTPSLVTFDQYEVLFDHPRPARSSGRCCVSFSSPSLPGSKLTLKQT